MLFELYFTIKLFALLLLMFDFCLFCINDVFLFIYIYNETKYLFISIYV